MILIDEDVHNSGLLFDLIQKTIYLPKADLTISIIQSGGDPVDNHKTGQYGPGSRNE